MTSTGDGSLPAAIEERRAALLRALQQLPPNGSRPLTVSARVAGWVTAKATAALRGLPGVHVEDEAVHITASSSPRLSLNAVLVRVAQALDEAGCIRTWRNEMLDVVGEGRRLAVIERGAVRPLGLLTRAVHLNAWTPQGDLWIARRAMTKGTDPGKWDTLVGGLAGAGEVLDTALVREASEEAGLSPEAMAGHSPLRVIVRLHKRLPEGYQVEDVLISECVLADDVVLANQDGEVSEFRRAGVEEVWALIRERAFTAEAELVLLEGMRSRLGLATHG
jgi:isopentenyldiphosphate isomerase